MNALERHTLRLIGEDIDNPDVFTDDSAGMALVRDSINNAIQELCMVSGSYVKTYHLVLLAERMIYRINPKNDYIAYVIQVWDRNNKYKLTKTDLNRLTQDDPYWLKRTGNQEQYIQLGFNNIAIYRAPSATGKILEMDCVCIPKFYDNDKAPIKVREQFQRAAVYYAVSEFYASRGDAKRAVEYFTRYLETAQIMGLKPGYHERQYYQQSQKQQGAQVTHDV